MKSRLLVVFSVFALAGAAPAADSQLLKLVMPDAKVVSGIDFDRVKSTPFGQFVLSQLPPGDSGFREFVAATGFDPLQDIHEVVMASPADVQKRSGLLLVRGRFDGQRILTLIKAIEQSSGGIKFGNMIEISGELTARTDKDATSLADVVKFFANMASMHGSGGDAGQVAALLHSLTVNAEANAVKLSVSIPEKDLEALIKLSHGSARPRI